jgi:hypothetical protein
VSTAITPEVVNHPQPPIRSAALDLNLRQKSFVDYYIEVKVGWKAAQLAGYSGDQNALCAIASENLRKPNIAAYYQERLAELAVSSNEVLAELGEIARAPWKEFVTIKTDPKTGAVLYAQLRLQDKLKALELAGKGHGLFTERVESSVSAPAIATEVVSLLVQLAERNRAAQLNAQQGVDGPVDDQARLVGESTGRASSGPSSSSSQPIIDVTATTRNGENGP